ncbi:MAG: hypothetical protein VW378_00175 [bacterium]
MVTSIVMIQLMIHLSEYFSKQLGVPVVFKWTQTETCTLASMDCQDGVGSYIQLFQKDDTRLVSMIEQDILSHLSSMFLGLKEPVLGSENLLMIEKFMGWLINKQLSLYLADQDHPLSKGAVLHSPKHIYCFNDEESVEMLAIHVFSDQLSLGQFRLLQNVKQSRERLS